MQYISTRGSADRIDFGAVTLAGLARDGGLYVPETIPVFDADTIQAMKGRSFAAIAFDVIRPFVGGQIDDSDLARIINDTYSSPFRHEDVAPLRNMGDGHYLLELFHGPTLAFKDFALQLLGRLFDTLMQGADQKLTILGATSGDTGSAAIEACRGRENIRIFMLHPKDRVSEVQRRQMTTILEDNVTNIAVDGTFDDCQALVKAAFNDLAFRDAVNLTAVNSINWARVMAQIVYYFTSAVALGAPEKRVAYSVPTGNFGDIFAGYLAKKMGLPIDHLVIATNSNDILARTLETGQYAQKTVVKTLSPSMDIQVSSNFERLLFDLAGFDAERVKALMAELESEGGFSLNDAELATLRDTFRAACVDDASTLAVMRDVYKRRDYLLDPHTAIGLAAARDCLADYDGPKITLATAHPAKFGAACEQATGTVPTLPDHLADLLTREERYMTMPNDLTALKKCMMASEAVPDKELN